MESELTYPAELLSREGKIKFCSHFLCSGGNHLNGVLLDETRIIGLD